MNASMVEGIDADILDAVETHAFSETTREVGGVLVGTMNDQGARICAAIPALRAVGSTAQVTFTHEVWDDVLAAIERDHPDQRIVGWYHSHPGFGIFLSEYDLFLHRSFFSDPRMLALVVDPIAGQSGWFGWRDEEIVELATARTRRAAIRPGLEPSGVGRGASRRHVGGLALLTALGFATLTFGLGYGLAPDGSSGNARQLQAERDAAVHERDALLAQRAAPTPPAVATPAPVTDPQPVRYRVRRGDTLSSLAQSFYGDASAASRLASSNDIDDPRSLQVGDVLVIRARP